MGTLSSTRTSNATKIGQTDNWDIELEADIAAIFGIDVDKAITSPIFASGSIVDPAAEDAVDGQVNADGSITGVLRFLNTADTSVAAAGVEFQSHSGTRHKICAIDDNLNLYVFNDDTEVWDLVASLDLGSGAFIGLTDVYDDTLVGKNKMIPQVIEDVEHPENNCLRLVAAPAGAQYIGDLLDVEAPVVDEDEGKVLTFWSDGEEGWCDWTAGGGGSGSGYFGTVITDSAGFASPVDEAGATLQVMRGPDPGDPLKIRPVFTPMAYTSMMNLTNIYAVPGLVWTTIPFVRVDANTYGWGDSEEGGEMSSYCFSSALSTSDFRIPSRFLGLYDVFFSFCVRSPRMAPVEVELNKISGGATGVYVISSLKIVPIGVYLWPVGQAAILNGMGVGGRYEARFSVMITSEPATPPVFNIRVRLPWEVTGSEGTKLVSTSTELTTLFIARRS